MDLFIAFLFWIVLPVLWVVFITNMTGMKFIIKPYEDRG